MSMPNIPFSSIKRACAYLVQADNLTIGLLDLLELGEEVPEARLGDDVVGGEDSHAIELRGGSRVGRQVPSDDLVLEQSRA